MNIIELVKQILTDCPHIADLTGEINIDFTEDSPISISIYPVGDQKIGENIMGWPIRQHNFVMYAVFQSFNDYERMANSTFLLNLAYWLEHAASNQAIETIINEQIVPGALRSLSSANGMLFDYMDGTLIGPVKYQLQIYAQYHLESEVL